MPKRFTLLFILVLAVLGWFIFSSLNVKNETFIIEGELELSDQLPSEVIAYFTQERKKPNDFEELNKAIIDSSGKFATRFRGIPNRKTFVYIITNGYIPVREDFVLTIPKEIIKLKPIYFPGSKEPELENEEDNTVEMTVYADNCLVEEEDKTFTKKEIQFFEDLTPLKCEETGLPTGFSAKMCISGKMSDFLNFKPTALKTRP